MKIDYEWWWFLEIEGIIGNFLWMVREVGIKLLKMGMLY